VSPDSRVLVVGTTPDYIDWIRRACPRRSLFVTDRKIRQRAKETDPGPSEELLCDLTDQAQALRTITAHTRQQGITIDGVACFDCESLSLAARLAETFGLSFPSPTAVANCRNKLRSKRLWLEKGLSAPQVVPVRQAEDVVGFFNRIGTDCVLKPVFGSGSELVFHCRTEDECRQAFALLDDGLCRRADNRLYRDASPDSPLMLAEAFVDATEFSCDFLLENSRARLIRLCQKIPAVEGSPFGTTRGYLLVDTLPGVQEETLCRHLAQAAMTLGLSRSICMADFMVRDGRVILLEITPRPGGDCLPALVRHAFGLDMLVLTLDLARNRSTGPEALPQHPECLAGLRLHARQAGVLKKINWEAVADDPRVREICPLRYPGDRVCLPPDDYETFLLGNIIFAPGSRENAVDECRLILSALTVEMEA
jgi:biotin carboxylase